LNFCQNMDPGQVRCKNIADRCPQQSERHQTNYIADKKFTIGISGFDLYS
jgi:hypothetical protein